MKYEGRWKLTASSPLGDESYTLTFGLGGTGHIEHPKGSVAFSGAILAPTGVIDVLAHTDVPMTTDFRIKLLMADSVGVGTLYIGDFAEVPIKAERI